MIFLKPGKNKHSRPDEELLKEFTLSGDLEVLGELYSGYIHLVYGVCLKYFKNRDDSMDAVMQIFEKLITEIPKQKIETFHNWLHVVTRNYCLMQLRSQKTNSEKIKEWMTDSIIFMENNTALHPIDEDNLTLENGLADCIERLKEEQRECIRQFYYGNRSYIEIALNLGLDDKKVKSYLQNAKRNLKLCLEEKNVVKK